MTHLLTVARTFRGLVLILGLAAAARPTPPPVAPARTVLLLSSFNMDYTGFREAIATTFKAQAKGPIEVFEESTDLDRFSGKAFEASLLDLYKVKYGQRKVDLIIVIGPTALDFLVAKKFLPGVPVVTCYVPRRVVETAREARPAMTGAVHPQNAPLTLDLMTTLYPRTRHVHLVMGATEYERRQAEIAMKVFPTYGHNLTFECTNDLTLEQMEAKVRTLGEEDLVLFGQLSKDAAGRDLRSEPAVARLAAASSRPMFGTNVVDLGSGILGGVLIDQKETATASAELALAILGGRPAASIPLKLNTGAVAMFDWRQLQRWKLKAGALPAGSVIQGREVSLWESHWKEILAGFSIILLEGLLVAALVLELQRRRRTERTLARAEFRYRTVANFTHDWEFWQRPDGTFEYLSPSCAEVCGHAPEAFMADPGLLDQLVLDEDRPGWHAFQDRALVGEAHSHWEFRLVTRAGEVRWVEQNNNPVRTGQDFAGTRGSIRDITTRKAIAREMAEAEVRYRTVADFTYDWEYWQRPDGTFEYLSPACERVSGHPPQAFRDTPGLLGQLVLEADRPAWQAHQGAALGGTAPGALEFQIRTRAGELRWVEQTNNPVQLAGGGFGGTRGSLRDITERKRGELDLKRAYGEIAALKDRLEAENTYYREQVQAVESSNDLLGSSDPMKYLQFRISQVAPSETTVLIQGETGTGKELVAEAIHAMGPRAAMPLIKVNCAALPHMLAESELFGHEKGAFTGAQGQRKGRFELADGATLFLDEIGELSPEVQAKMLRVLQEGEFQRVGGDRTLRVDVRVIAATNRDLTKEVQAGRFREDLWYRMNVFPITVPPLRERKADLPALTQAFVARCCQKLGRPVLDLPNAVLQTLAAYPWPGNVRELQNVVERAVLVSQGPTLHLADPPLAAAPDAGEAPPSPRSMEAMERDHIRGVLESTHWKVEGPRGAAALLDLKPSTLRNRMVKLEIRRSPGP